VDFWIIFWLLGFAGAGLFCWIYYRKTRKGADKRSLSEEVDFVIAECKKRLASSKLSGAKIGKLPVVYMLGARRRQDDDDPAFAS
jgi:hypothetical protein